MKKQNDAIKSIGLIIKLKGKMNGNMTIPKINKTNAPINICCSLVKGDSIMTLIDSFIFYINQISYKNFS